MAPAWSGGSLPFGKAEVPQQCVRHPLDRIPGPRLGLRHPVGHVDAPEPLSEYVLGLAHDIIKPQFRGGAGFDDPVDVPPDASALDQLVAFTGRDPAG